jgi:exodeoxyribonuclease VII small subunit
MNSSEFEKKIEKSKEILEKLMDPQISLSDGVKYYKEGLKQLKEANELLEKAKLTFEELQAEDEQ